MCSITTLVHNSRGRCHNIHQYSISVFINKTYKSDLLLIVGTQCDKTYDGSKVPVASVSAAVAATVVNVGSDSIFSGNFPAKLFVNDRITEYIK